VRRMVVLGIVSLVIVLGWPTPSSASATVHTYPSASPPCNTTLQACIDGASPGDVIRIVTNTPIAEIPIIGKSLTLEAGAGYHPVIEFGLFAYAETTATSDILVRGLTFQGQVRARFTQGSGHLFMIRDSRVFGDDFGGVSLDATGASASFAVIDNVIRVSGHQVDQVDIVTSDAFGSADFAVVGNRMSSADYPESHAGIRASFYGTGTATADIYSNVISRVGGCFCGYAAAIGTDANQNVDATMNIVGNTIHRPRIGIGIRGSSDSSQFDVNLFNNIIARSVGTGLSVQEDTTGFTFRNGFNDFFQNGQALDWGGYQPGPATLHRNPRFVDQNGSNYRLRSGSPLINRGIVCSPGGTPRIDAAGHDRISGPTVDMGAYESGSSHGPGPGRNMTGSPGADTLLGGPGHDVLCGLGGGDKLLGRGGRDLAFGGSGSDRLKGGSLADRLVGGTGADALFGRGGPDVLQAVDGTNGNDSAVGGPGSDHCAADPGDTVLSC
jgi:hypothetical protein